MKYKKRQLARRIAMQLIYSWQINKAEITKLQQYYIEDNRRIAFDQEYFIEITKGVTEHISIIDTDISKIIDINNKSLGIVEQAILRIGFFELIFKTDITHKIIINEAIELAKIFGASKSYKFINGVLDKYKDITNQKVQNG